MFALLSSLSIVSGASAQGTITLRAHVGFQDYFDPRVWVPVRVNISSSLHHSFSGALEYRVAKGSASDGPYEGVLEWPVRLRARQSTIVTVGVPGQLLRRGGSLTLVSGNQTVAGARLIGVSEEGPDIAGVVSDNPAMVQFLAGVSSSNGTSELVTAYISPDSVPLSAELLQSLTYMYIDGKAAQELTAAQAKTIFTWVRMGGILILGGVQPNAGQLNEFSRVSPVSGSIVLDKPGDALSTFAGASVPRGVLPQEFGPAASDATVLVGSRSAALVAVRFIGRGEVAYAGLNPDTPALLTWSGNAMFWDAALHALNSSVLSAKSDLFGGSGSWTLMNAAEQFPQLHSPPLWIWELVFGLYITLCGPILYIVLRRRRKNEWAWGVLPLVSVALAGAIYELGVLQRPNGILTQSVGLIDVVDDSLAQAVGVEALMSPQTRSYNVRMPSNTWALPMADRASELGDVRRTDHMQFSPYENLLQFRDVGAWGGRFVFGTRTLEHFGMVKGVLFSSGNSLGGYVVNDTGVNFSDAALIVKGQVLALGALKKGSSARVEWMRRASGRSSLFASQLGAALPSASHGVGRALFDYVTNFAVAPAPVGTVVLIAWSHSEPSLFKTDGPVFPAAPQWIIREVLPVTPVTE